MRTLGVVAAILLVGVVVLFGGPALGLFNLSFWGPKYEEARREIVQQSIRRQEGVSEGVGALCLNMRLEKDPASRSAFASLIVQQATATGTELSVEARQCVVEAEAQLGV